MTMKAEFCKEFDAACSEELDLATGYCAYHVGDGVDDQYWSYPLVVDSELSGLRASCAACSGSYCVQ